MADVRRTIPKLICIVIVTHSTYFIAQAKVPAEEVEGVAGSLVRLPCRVRNVDRLVIVLWFRRKFNVPFYSLDARSGNLSGISGQAHDDVFGPRSQLVLRQNPSNFSVDEEGKIPVFPGWLQLRDIKRKDAGSYTCRVEFLDSPTQTHHLRLTVYELPKVIQVVDDRREELGRESNGNYVTSPVDEGGTLHLSCLVRGGWPDCHLEWFWGGEPVVGVIEDIGSGWRERKLVLHSIERKDHTKSLWCEVSNNPLTLPNTSHVTLQMNLRPTSVTIYGADEGFPTGTHQELLCISSGSIPPADITWTVDEQHLTLWKPLHVSQKALIDGSTESSVLWKSTPSHDGLKIMCTASNPRVKRFYLTNETTVIVFHPPIVKFSIGRGLDPKFIREATDVYFTCKVKANPPQTSIKFYKNETVIEEVKTKSVVLAGDSLALRNISPSDSGNYSCKASNAKGKTKSNKVLLSVQFRPRCVSPFQSVGVRGGKNVSVDCTVEAFPADVQFSWSVNSSHGLRVLPHSTFEVKGRESILWYRMNPNDRKVDILCSAENNLGRQIQPCITRLLVADIPSRLKHCSMTNPLPNSLSVFCTPHLNDTTIQTFVMKVMEGDGERLVANQSSLSPNFTALNLKSGMDYMIYVYAVNSQGWSPPYLLDRFSLKIAENRIDSKEGRKQGGISTLSRLLFGIILTVGVLIGGIVGIARLRYRKTSREEALKQSRDETHQMLQDREIDAAFDCTSALLKQRKQPPLNKASVDPAEGFDSIPPSEYLRDSPTGGNHDQPERKLRFSSNLTQSDNGGGNESTFLHDSSHYLKDSLSIEECDDVINRRRMIPSMDSQYCSYTCPSQAAQAAQAAQGTQGVSYGRRSPTRVPLRSMALNTIGKDRGLYPETITYHEVGVKNCSPTSSVSLLLPPLSSQAVYGTSYTLGRCHNSAKESCTKRPNESFV